MTGIDIIAGANEEGSRLDRFLRKRLPLLGLSDIYALIRKGKVRVNGKRGKAEYRLKMGDILLIKVNPSELAPDNKPDHSLGELTKTSFFKHNFNVIYEDEAILACNKPAGLVVHPGSGHVKNDTLIDLATAYLLSKQDKGNADEPPVLMHRLDKDTSGVILLAKNKGVVRKLHRDMQNELFFKQYVAICHNRPPEYVGTIATGLKRDDRSNSGMKMRVAKSGPMAKSSYKIVEYHNDISQLEIVLHTGKTHQIRVQMAHLSSPVVGDTRYGSPDLDQALFSCAQIPRRLYLHACKLSFPHPVSSRKITLKADTPAEFRAVHRPPSAAHQHRNPAVR